VCCPRKGTGIGFAKADDPAAGYNLHGRSSRHQTDDLGGAWPLPKYELHATKHIAVLRKARPDIIVEIRWCPAHKGVPGNEKADEWAKLAVAEPDAREVGWLSYLGRAEACAMPVPRSLAHLKREVSGEKWAEARQWAEGRTSRKKYKMPKSQRPDGTVAGSTKRLASWFYQVKTGHCLTGQYLHWTKNQRTAQCWTGRRPGITYSRSAPSGSPSRRSCGQRC